MIAVALAWWLALPPRGWWALFPLGVAGFVIALRGHGVRVRIGLGVLCGAVLYSVSLRWLTDFSVPGYIAVVLLETGLLCVVAALTPGDRGGRWAGSWLVAPAALVLLEAVQYRFPFGGFPLPALGLSLVDSPFIPAAPIGGALLVTGLAALSGAALAVFVLGPNRQRSVAAVVGVFVVVGPLYIGDTPATRAAGTLDAVIVQGGGPRGLRAVFTDSMDATERHIAAAELVRGSADVVLLPENVADVDGPIAGAELNETFAELAQRLDTNLVVGITEGDGDRFRNASVLWGPDGALLDRYEKEHRVPFGEYIPARALFERLSDDTMFVPRDAVVGEGDAVLESTAPPMGIVISYEVFFADRVAEAVIGGGQIVLAPTNASSYVGEEVPAIEVAASRQRAREFGRTVLQAAPTGYSAIILPDGTVTQQSGLGRQEVLEQAVPLREGLTLYARVGDAPVIGLAAASILWCLIATSWRHVRPGIRKYLPSQRAR